MKNLKLAFRYFFLAYIIGTVVGFATYYIHEVVMWISLFTIMPVVFGYYFYMYLKNSACDPKAAKRETNILVAFWIILSFLLDALAYTVIMPLAFHIKPNYTFFIEQSPWIWLNYATIIILGHISRVIFQKRFKTSVTPK
jgi:H+/Cl- antiporter ClcA